MKAVFCTLALLAIGANAAIETDTPNNLILGDAATITSEVAYVSSAARGSIQGYMKGMYKNANYKIRDECLSGETQKKLVEIVTMWGTPEQTIGDAFNKITEALIKVSDWCDFDEALYGWLNFCYDTEQCEIPNMV